MSGSLNTPPVTPAALPEAVLSRFAREVAKYPDNDTGRQSAVMACLAIVQQEQGAITQEAEQDIADHLGMPQIAVHEVTTFYNMYNQQKLGKYKLNVCTRTAIRAIFHATGS